MNARELPLLLGGVSAIATAWWSLITEQDNDAWGAATWTLGCLLLGAWLALEIERVVLEHRRRKAGEDSP